MKKKNKHRRRYELSRAIHERMGHGGQKELAERLGHPNRFRLARIIQGIQDPLPGEAVRIAQILNTKRSELGI